MQQYVGADYILTTYANGLMIRKNDDISDDGEFFDWEEILHLLPNHTCSICTGGKKILDT